MSDQLLNPNLYCYKGPVTATLVCSNRVIVGAGNEVSIWKLGANILQARTECLKGAAVHGLVKGPTKEGHQLICVYGGKQACVFMLKCDEERDTCLFVPLSEVFHFEQWIWHTQWLTHKDGVEHIAVALAHNTVFLWNWTEKSVVEKQNCAVKCILYSANFIGDTWHNLVLAAGTVFKKVVLWLVADVDNDGKQKQSQPLPVVHTLSGHKGVIFSIRYHAGHQILCSVSDDRSICLWKLHFPCSKSATPSAADWKCVKSDLVMSRFGHQARVWDAVLMESCFASIGEDATCCVWDYSGNIVLKLKGHKGKSVWSIACTEDEQFLLTGGGDGSIRVWDIINDKSRSTSLYDVEIPEHVMQENGDCPRVITMLNFETLLIMLKSGSLFSYDVLKHTFALVFRDQGFHSYCVVAPCVDKQKVAVGSINGVIKVLRQPDLETDIELLCEKQLYNGKVLQIVWLDKDYILATGPEGICTLMKCTPKDTDASEQAWDIVQVKQLHLPAGKHRWITAACFAHFSVGQQCSDCTNEMIVCGDKDGSVRCYNLTEEKSPEEASSLEHDLVKPYQSFHRVHGKAGVTSICEREGFLYSSGRDGHYRQWKCQDGQLIQVNAMKITKGFEWIDRVEWVNNNLLAYGFFSSRFVVWSTSFNQEWMSVQCGGGHRFWGCILQNGTLRFAYLKTGRIHIAESKESSRQTLLQPALHGKKVCDIKFLRSITDEKGHLMHLACTASEDTTVNIGVFYDSQGFACWRSLAVLKGHLSNVRALAISDRRVQGNAEKDDPCQFKHKENSSKLLFTGGGRAEIRVWKLNISNKQSNHCDLVEDNCVSLKKNAQSESETSFVSDQANEKPHSSEGFGTDQSQSSLDNPVCTVEHLSTHFLGESRHKNPKFSWKTKRLCLDPETRVMSLAVTSLSEIQLAFNGPAHGDGENKQFDMQDNSCVLSVAGSDGYVRMFVFDEPSQKFHLIAQSHLHHGCILKVWHLLFPLKPNGDSNLYILSTSTNGRISFWPTNKILNEWMNSNHSAKAAEGKVEDETLKCNKEFADVTSNFSSVRVDSTDYCDTGAQVGTKEEMWQVLCELKSHQNGINCIHTLELADSSVLLVSGGDDNAITLQHIQIRSGLDIVKLSEIKHNNAHAAQITGIWMVSPTIIVSVSIDQRVCIWDADLSLRKMQLLGCRYIFVSDVSCMDVCIDRNSIYLYIGGEGMCLYSFKH